MIVPWPGCRCATCDTIRLRAIGRRTGKTWMQMQNLVYDRFVRSKERGWWAGG